MQIQAGRDDEERDTAYTHRSRAARGTARVAGNGFDSINVTRLSGRGHLPCIH